MPAESLAAFGTDPDILGQESLGERADLDRESDVADQSADIFFLPLALKSNGRPDGKAAVFAEQPHTDAFVRRLEGQWRALATNVEIRQRPDPEFVRAGEVVRLFDASTYRDDPSATFLGESGCDGMD